MTDQSDFLGPALKRITRADSPEDAAMALLRACLASVSAESGRVYLLQPGSVELQPYVSVPDGAADHGRPIDVRSANPSKASIGPLAAFLRAAHRERHQPREDVGTVIYSYRQRSCIGAVRIDALAPEHISAAQQATLRDLANLLVTIYEDRFAFDLLGAIQEPLDFRQSSDAFFSDIAKLIARSSSMEFAALRERDGDALRCIALYGFDNLSLSREAWDLDPITAFPAFQRAADGHTVAIRDARDTSNVALGAIPDQPWSEPVGSFVAVPIQVGTEIFGVLSVAARAPFDYSPLELRGFESIANGVGVSITNFRNSRDLATQVTTQAEAAVAITGIEVARVAKHEAAGYINNASIRLHRLRQELPKVSQNATGHLDKMEVDMASLGKAIDKISLVTKIPKEEWKPVRLRQLWDEAENAVAGRLQADKIDDHWQGPDNLEVWAVRDRLRHVFLNLLLNSIDAFEGARARGRRIDIVVERPPARARDIVITYRDNGTGVNPSRLSVPDEYTEEPVSQQVFGAAVTSKDDGSGYGLWLARKVVTEHGGSIDLADYRSGATFVMRLPKMDSWNPRKDSKK